MADERIKKLAEILVDYSTEVKKGDYVYLTTTSFEPYPLIEEIYKKVLQKGAYLFPRIGFDPNVTIDSVFLRYACEEQLNHLPEIALEEMRKMDVTILIGADINTRELSGIKPERIAMRKKAIRPVIDEVINNTKRIVTRYPTNAYAQDAGMSLKDFEDFYYGACLINWKEESRKQDKVKEVFDAGKTVRIIGKETDLTFSIEGRPGIKCDGKRNMPDGEVFYAPVEDSASGVISYSFPAVYLCNEVDGIVLKFKDGKVVEARAEKNEEFLRAMLETDTGSRFIGEFGIGVNYQINQFVRNILFDEKIGGTIHLALGNAYEKSGGKNRSGIHWDMVKDLREGGEIHLDGKVVQKNGLWVFDK